MELRQLEYFCAVSSLESFTKAANFLHVSQPSVTKTVQALETELKIELFDRSQKHICLTESGAVFLIHAKKILQDVQEAKSSIERFQNQSNSIIRFGVPPIVESYLFPNFFIKFTESNPKITLELQECSDSIKIHEKIENDELDFGIIFSIPENQQKNSLTLLEDEFYLCLPHDHKFANLEKVSFDALREEKFILQPPGTVQNLVTLQRSAKAGFAPEILLNTSQVKTIKELVSSNAAIALIPKFAITESTSFKAIPIDPPIKFNIALAWSELKELSPLFTHFLNFVEKLFSKK